MVAEVKSGDQWPCKPNIHLTISHALHCPLRSRPTWPPPLWFPYKLSKYLYSHAAPSRCPHESESPCLYRFSNAPAAVARTTRRTRPRGGLRGGMLSTPASKLPVSVAHLMAPSPTLFALRSCPPPVNASISLSDTRFIAGEFNLSPAKSFCRVYRCNAFPFHFSFDLCGL